MQLPGGIPTPAGLDRSFSFKPIVGATELAIVEALERPHGWSRQVTAVLVAALDALGGQAATADAVRDLAVGDRQFLLRQLEIRMRGDELWRAETCEHCGERFDLCVRHSSLPVKAAKTGFPRVRMPFGPEGTMTEFRVPTGRDQEALEAVPPGEDPRLFLARRLFSDPPERTAEFKPAELAALEAALEAVAPEVTTEGRSQCPHCGETSAFPLDPGALLLHASADHLLAEIHRLALAYHWSEAEILALPRTRRQRYLDLIDQSRGLRHDLPNARPVGF